MYSVIFRMQIFTVRNNSKNSTVDLREHEMSPFSESMHGESGNCMLCPSSCTELGSRRHKETLSELIGMPLACGVDGNELRRRVIFHSESRELNMRGLE